MSRSFKNVAMYGVHGGSKVKQTFKKTANKKVRNSFILNDGSMYKKIFKSWNICDYKALEFNDEVIKNDYRARRK